MNDLVSQYFTCSKPVKEYNTAEPRKDIKNKDTFVLFNKDIKFENSNFENGLYVGIRPEDISLENKSEIAVENHIQLKRKGKSYVPCERSMLSMLISKGCVSLNPSILKLHLFTSVLCHKNMLWFLSAVLSSKNKDKDKSI